MWHMPVARRRVVVAWHRTPLSKTVGEPGQPSQQQSSTRRPGSEFCKQWCESFVIEVRALTHDPSSSVRDPADLRPVGIRRETVSVLQRKGLAAERCASFASSD